MGDKEEKGNEGEAYRSRAAINQCMNWIFDAIIPSRIEDGRRPLAVWRDTTNPFLREETQYLDICTRYGNRWGRKSKNNQKHESKFCSRGVARYHHTGTTPEKVSTIRSTMALLRGTIGTAPSKVHFLYASLHYTLVGRKE
jgi:hypothetical protein